MASPLDKVGLFKHHMIPLAKYVNSKKNKNGESIKTIIWDDMMRSWPAADLSDISKHVTPMVWAYTAELAHYRGFPADMWYRYTQGFKEIYIASSFKGALKAWTNFVPTTQHLMNHLSWMQIIANLSHTDTNVLGIAITGWSRFDHYAPLCELLPAGVPTLSLCLAILNSGHYSPAIHEQVSEKLGFPHPFNTNVDYFKRYVPEQGSFPGSDVYTLVGQLEHALGFHYWGGTRVTGWTRPFHIARGHLSFYHLNATLEANEISYNKLAAVRESAGKVLAKYFDQDTVNEWVADKVVEAMKETKRTRDKLRKLIRVNKFH